MTMLLQEVKAVREKVGAIEIASFANHKFTGKGARKFFRSYVLAGQNSKSAVE